MRSLLPLTLIPFLIGCSAIKLETTLFTDCAWYEPPAELSAEAKAAIAGFVRDNPGIAEELRGFLDRVADNKELGFENCGAGELPLPDEAVRPPAGDLPGGLPG